MAAAEPTDPMWWVPGFAEEKGWRSRASWSCWSGKRREHLYEQLPAETFEEGQLMMATHRNFWPDADIPGLASGVPGRCP